MPDEILKTPQIHGLIPFHKPVGMISKDLSRNLLSWLRKHQLITKKIPIGHVGSLDPLAEGVLPILLGRATRLQDYLLHSRKVYELTTSFGVETDTLDSTGKPLRSAPLPYLCPSLIEKTIKNQKGEHQQIPPLYSAVKYRGKPLYFYARKSKLRPPTHSLKRRVRVYEMQLQEIIYKTQHAPQGEVQALRVKVVCSRGTYVRVLCQKLAHDLGSLATMSALKRLETAGITLDQCCNLDDFKEPQDFFSHLIPLEKIPLPLPRIAVSTKEQELLYQGKKLSFSAEELKTHDSWQTLRSLSRHQEHVVLMVHKLSKSVVSLGTLRFQETSPLLPREVSVTQKRGLL